MSITTTVHVRREKAKDNARDSLLEVLDTVLEYHHHKNTEANPLNEETPLVASVYDNNHNKNTANHSRRPPTPLVLSDDPIAHYTTTFLIVVTCYISAIKVPGVAIVWSLCGSSMAFSIAFILPAACFLQIVHEREQIAMEDNNDKRKTVAVVSKASKIMAWFLLIASILAAIVCTAQTIELLL